MSNDSMITNHYTLDDVFIKFDLLDKAVIDSTVVIQTEVITIEPYTNSYTEGFKLFYNDQFELMYGKYWRLELTPNKVKRHYNERQLTPMELGQVIEWKNNLPAKKSFLSKENIL